MYVTKLCTYLAVYLLLLPCGHGITGVAENVEVVIPTSLVAIKLCIDNAGLIFKLKHKIYNVYRILQIVRDGKISQLQN